MELVKQKISQATGLLRELEIDMWLIVVRETMMMADPIFPLVVGADAVWPSFFIFTGRGDAIALVGNFDQELFTQGGRFSEVIPYTEGAGQALRDLIERLDPRRIALDYSTDNPAADGLTHGMYLLLHDYLAGTPYVERFTSAQDLCARLRSRKNTAEIERISAAAEIAGAAWAEAVDRITPGMTEIEIAGVIRNYLNGRGVAGSFDAIVNAGDKTKPGHGRPTEAVLEPGDLLHVDFGARYRDYCSDLQRLVYFRKSGETTAPRKLTKAFTLVRNIITETARLCRPGISGWEVDALARKMLTDNGYPEYQHALGHQLGRQAHDGGAVIGPRWERYGNTAMIPLEVGNVFTLELEIMLPGIGCVGLEEDVVLEDRGARFLGPRQEELIVR